jgi:hypothetical protein
MVTTSSVPTLHSYGSLTHATQVEEVPTTAIIDASALETTTTTTARVSSHSPKRRTSCLKPHQSETVFAFCLFSLGLILLIYVMIRYWFMDSRISSIIIFICGLLCFIPGCYYLFERYCFCLRCQRNRLRRVPITERDDIV